jgi:hypothetical protein
MLPVRLLSIAVLSFVVPAVAAGQGVDSRIGVQGAFGTNVNAGGNNQSISVGFAPSQRLDLLISVERIHLPMETTQFGATRGGTTTFVSGEVRFVPLTFSRTSPYAITGLGRGTARPNVNETFPNPAPHDAWLLFLGGGVSVPMTRRFSAFADMRFGFQSELDTISLLMPVRAGVALRF